MKRPALFPAPRSARWLRSRLDLRTAHDWQLDAAFDGRVLRLALEVRDAHFAAGRIVRGVGVVAPKVLLRRDPELGFEAYRLEVQGGQAVLAAAGSEGMMLALQTLRQLGEGGGGVLSGVRIEDEPDFGERGFMLDVSRCKVPKLATLFGLIDRMAQLKLNRLQLYTEHTFAFAAHETVWRGASPYTAEDVLRIQAYGRERGVELVPNFNSFGHWERWLCHAAYRDLANCPEGCERPWGGRSSCGTMLKPNRASLRLLASLYAELLPNFDGEWFNVGCDETYELGRGWSKKRCDEKGKGRVYLDFLQRLEKRVRGCGKKMMFWGDIILHHPELIAALPSDVQVLNWGYEAGHPFEREGAAFADAGVPFQVCPGTSSWRSLTGRVPNAVQNLRCAARAGRKHGACGYLITDWGDCGHLQTLPLSYPGLLAGACFAWGVHQHRKLDVEAGLNQVFFGGERDAATARWLVGLGSEYEQLSETFVNSTAFFQLLLLREYREYREDRLRALPAAGWGVAAKRFAVLREQLAELRPGGADGALVGEELETNLSMAELAVRRGLGWQDAGQVKGWARDMARVIDQHEACWLARNRVGGLRESSDYLWREAADC